MSILIIIIGIAALILIHEIGHFVVAKAMGLLVEEFGFGFPPRLFSKKIGETTYSFNALPLGGYVKIAGEDRPGQQEVEPPKSLGGSTPKNLRVFYARPAWQRASVIAAGVLMNFLLGWLLLSAVFMIGTPRTLLVSEVLPGSPAELVGLKSQDQIVGYGSAKQFIDFVNANRGKEITVQVRRGSEELSFQAVPRVKDQAALGVALIEAGIERHSFFAGLWDGLKAAGSVVGSIFAAFGNLLLGFLAQGRLVGNVVGPVGIFGVANQAGALGFVYLIQLVALISLNLTVLNILPFPALDGGRLLFVILEKIKGSPLDQRFERLANSIGFMVLLLLMIAITVRDVVRLF